MEKEPQPRELSAAEKLLTPEALAVADALCAFLDWMDEACERLGCEPYEVTERV